MRQLVRRPTRNDRRTRRRTVGAALCASLGALLLLGAPGAAHAHLVTTGLGPFYDGITHLAVSPADLLAVIALSLLAGLGGPARGRLVLATLPVAWLLGGLIGLRASQEASLPLAVSLSLFALGALVAADARLPRPAAGSLAALTGLLYGGMNGTALAGAGAGALGLFGIATAVAVLATLLGAAAVSAGTSWRRIVVRVAGSWVAAVAILMLGWAFRG